MKKHDTTIAAPRLQTKRVTGASSTFHVHSHRRWRDRALAQAAYDDDADMSRLPERGPRRQRQPQKPPPPPPPQLPPMPQQTSPTNPGLRRRYSLIGTFVVAAVMSLALTSSQGQWGRGMYGAHGDSVLDAAWRERSAEESNLRGGARPGGLAGAADVDGYTSSYSAQQLRQPVAPNLVAAVTIEKQRQFPAASTLQTEQQSQQEQQQRIDVPPNQGVADCSIKEAVPGHSITPTYTASYPGSGAKMTWNLIQTLTGVTTGDEHGLNGLDLQKVVSVKTHHPHPEGAVKLPEKDVVPRVILLVRNPLTAIPSYFNYLYERRHNLPGHSTKAPLEEWLAWRDENFEEQFRFWSNHLIFWMDHYPGHGERIVLQYERLTDNDWGHQDALRLAEFLSRSDGVTVRNSEEVPCIWNRVVKYKGGRRRLQQSQGVLSADVGIDGGRQLSSPGREIPQQQRSLQQQQKGQKQQQQQQQQKGQSNPPTYYSNPIDPQSKRSGPSYIPPYTASQLQSAVDALSDLLSRYPATVAESPHGVLVMYLEDAKRRLREGT